MKETWISAVKAKKKFNICKEELDKLEKDGLVQTMLAVGNRKLYLAAGLEKYSQERIKNTKAKDTDAMKKTTNFLKKFFKKFFNRWQK